MNCAEAHSEKWREYPCFSSDQSVLNGYSDRGLLCLSVFLPLARLMSLLVARTGMVSRLQLPTAKKAGGTQSPLHRVTAANRSLAV